jgi:hypothetical protein
VSDISKKPLGQAKVMPIETTTLWRPIGPSELALIMSSGMRAFPPRLPEQPSRYEIREAGGREHREYWIPAEDLVAFNAAIIGQIEIVAEFPGTE